MLAWIEEHPVLVGVVGVLLPLLFKRLRALPITAFRAFQRWAAKDRLAWQSEFKSEVLGRLDSIEAKADRANSAIFNGGTNGMLQQMQLLTADASREFERTAVPMFKCDQNGNNLATNSAYRKLIGATKEESLSGQRWKSVIYGELATGYLETFRACTEAEEDFYAECDFRNPMTGEHRGRWRVIAPVLHVGNGSIWIGSLDYALDSKARELVALLGFEVEV